MSLTTYMTAPLLLTLLACGGDGGRTRTGAARTPAPAETSGASASETGGVADALGSGNASLSASELDRGRLQEEWKKYVTVDSAAPDSSRDAEQWSDISAASLARRAVHLPLHGDVAGPSVAKVQVLLDRALFSPGIIDGRWGKNTSKAVYWLQRREGLRATGEVDTATFARLRRLAGDPPSAARTEALTGADVRGPFVDIPDDVYAKAKLDCLCYQSLGEKLAERYHTSERLLEQLNPGLPLDSLQAGDSLVVPAVRDSTARAGGQVARIVVSDAGHYVHAEDSTGRVLYHFPSTLGSEYAPSPSGDFRVTAVAWDPRWHYQPKLLTGEADTLQDAMLPPGPNNAVGVVWMQLSKPHYGIHGTSAPETIGYVTSHGCVRLTNWDARLLGHRIRAGVPVTFVDITARKNATAGPP